MVSDEREDGVALGRKESELNKTKSTNLTVYHC